MVCNYVNMFIKKFPVIDKAMLIQILSVIDVAIWFR